MPNRILKESICTSEEIDRLSAFQETFFYRLIVTCDDYGRMDARPKILASKLFPLKDIRTAQIEDALRALTSAELVILYNVGGKPFLQMKTWDRHQSIRAKKSRYPSPDDVNASEINCMQMQADECKCPRNPIQSESNPNPNTKEKAPTRHKYGQYDNVLLSDEEMDKLKAEFPDWEERIERLSEYIASTGKTYKSHLATIRAWARKDAEKPKPVSKGPMCSKDQSWMLKYIKGARQQ